jgi:hypothetical protein
MKRLLSLLVITGIVAVAGYKAGVWYLADQRLAQARAALSDYGVLKRGQIGSTFGGALVLKQAGWEDFRLTRPLEAGQVTFDAGSPVTLLSFLLDPRPLPANWTLTADSVSLQLEPAMFRTWVTQGASPQTTAQPLVALSCGPDARQQPGSGDLLRMGIRELAGDILLRQTVDALVMEINTGKTGSLELRWPEARLNLQRPEAIADSSGQAIEVTVRDAGLMRKLSAYCVRETGLELGQWLTEALDALTEGLAARGYQPSKQLLALYRRWLAEGGELSFPVTPQSPTLGIPVHGTEAEEPGNWPVRWNGNRVPEVYLTRVETPEPESAKEPAESSPTQGEARGPAWLVETLTSAENWLGRQVRVTLNSGKQVEGRLERVGDRELEIARMLDTGEVVYPILKRAISTFEVWRRAQPD